jgi:Flp pilus assembly protein TadG
MKIGSERRGRQSGSAMVEIVLMAPWIFFLFMGVMDAGFYAYAAICLQNAARAAAVQTAANINYAGAAGADTACLAAWNEMSNLPNVYSATPPTSCAGLPSSVLTVTTNLLCGQNAFANGITACPNGAATPTLCADCALNHYAASSQAVVTYTTVRLVPIPGIIPSQITLTRVAEARILQE